MGGLLINKRKNKCKKIFSNKKGVAEALREIMYLLFAVAAILLIAYVFNLIWGTFIAVDRGTSKNFQLMVEKINEIKAGEPPMQYAFYMKKGLVIIGFGANEGKVVYNCGLARDRTIASPSLGSCTGKTCMCVCKDGSCTKIEECKELVGVNNIYFNETKKKYTFNAGEKVPGTDFTYVCIRIGCGINFARADATDLFEIEKKEENGQINVYLRKI